MLDAKHMAKGTNFSKNVPLMTKFGIAVKIPGHVRCRMSIAQEDANMCIQLNSAAKGEWSSFTSQLLVRMSINEMTMCIEQMTMFAKIFIRP